MIALSPYDYLVDSTTINNLDDNTNYVPGARVGVSCQQGIASRANSIDIATSSDYLGPILDKRLAVQIAKGDINPKTMLPFDSEAPFVQHSYMGMESRADTQGVKRLKGLTAKRDLFSEFNTQIDCNNQTSSSSSSSSSSSLVIHTKLPATSTACKTPPKTTWINGRNANDNVTG
jgi:hypothetical protein